MSKYSLDLMIRKKAPFGVPLELRVERYAHGGDGVATVIHNEDRRAVFLSRSARGDLAQVRVDFSSRPARAELVRLIEASSARQEPPCPYFHTCGGCNWMHLAPNERAEAIAALANEGNIEAPPILAHVPTAPLGVRTRARIHVQSARNGSVAIGFFGEGSHVPVPVDRCLALHPSLERARQSLGTILAGVHGHGEAQLALGTLTTDPNQRRAVLELSFSGDLPGSVYRLLDESIASATGAWAGARITTKGMSKPSVVGDPTPWTLGGDGLPLALAAGGFGQASDEGNAFLAKLVDERAQATGAKRIVELYSGAGNFTVLLARWAEKLTAVESHEGSTAACRVNLAARNLKAHAVAGDASAYDIPRDAELVVLDPPRTGAREVAEKLARSKVKSVIYVSCDARSLQRDLEILTMKYNVVSFETVDLFPQTSHFETVVVLS